MKLVELKLTFNGTQECIDAMTDAQFDALCQRINAECDKFEEQAEFVVRGLPDGVKLTVER